MVHFICVQLQEVLPVPPDVLTIVLEIKTHMCNYCSIYCIVLCDQITFFLLCWGRTAQDYLLYVYSRVATIQCVDISICVS